MREYGTPALVDIPDSANLTDIVFKRAADEPGAVALRRKAGDGWRDVTAGQFHGDVVAVAKGLIAAGIESGDRIGLMSRTRYEWTQIDYAILAAGAVSVPIYETSSAEQVEWILSDSGAKGVFVETPAHEARVVGVRDKAADLGHIWQIDAGGLGELAAAGADVPDEEIGKRRASRGAADIATIIYTSGTTGRPRGCELTHRNLLSDARNAFSGSLAEAFDIADGSTLLFLPLAHVIRPRIIQIGAWSPATISATRQTSRIAAGSGRVPADVRAGGAARVREGLQHGRAAGAGTGQGQDLRPRSRRWRSPTARRLRRGQRPHPAQAPARCVRQAGVRQAACRARRTSATSRSPAAHRSAPGSATSSAASASRFYEGYGLTETTAGGR